MNKEQTSKQADHKKSLAEEIAEQVKEQNTLFIDQQHEPYIAINKSGGQVMKLSSREFGGWLRNNIIKNHQRFQGLDTLVDVVSAMLIYEATMNGECHELTTPIS